jgi:hypothetical protein
VVEPDKTNRFGFSIELRTNDNVAENHPLQISFLPRLTKFTTTPQAIEAISTPNPSQQWQQDTVLSLEGLQEGTTGVSNTDLTAMSLRQDKCVLALTFRMYVNVAWVPIHTYK